MLKFGRTYTLTIQTRDGGTIVLTNPLTLEFSITRAFLASVNTGIFRVYNLGLQTRNTIYKDPFSVLDPTKFRRISLKAGYGSSQALIFDGNIQTGMSYRAEGSTNFITELIGYDGGNAVANSQTTASYSSGTGKDQVIGDIVNNLVGTGGVSIGRVDPLFPGQPYPRGRSLSDKSWKLLQLETGNRAFIDNGKIYVLADGAFTSDDVLVVSANTGLLGSPKRQDAFISVDILFEPQVRIGQRVELISLDNTIYSGTWQVRGISHIGTISDAVCGTAKTTLQLYNAFNLETIIQQLAA